MYTIVLDLNQLADVLDHESFVLSGYLNSKHAYLENDIDKTKSGIRTTV